MAIHTISVKDTAGDKTGQPTFGLLFELEFLAVPGREAAFGVYQSLLQDHNKRLSEGQFCRLVTSARPAADAEVVASELGLKPTAAAKMAQDVVAGLQMFYASEECRLNPALGSLLDAAVARGMKIATLTVLPETIAQKLMAKLGMDKWQVKCVCDPDPTRPFPRAHGWLQAARAISVKARRCIALCTSNIACRSALAAGMRVVAVPDRFTLFHDFSGSEQVIEDLTAIDHERLLDELLRPTYVLA